MRAFSLVCVLAFFSCLVFATQAKFKVDFILTDASLYPNGEIPGTVYYLYNTDSPQSSKVRYEFSLSIGGNALTIVELEDFSVSKLFKICTDKCETYPLSRTAQQWWFKNGDVKTQEVDSEGFTHYTRKFTDYGITDLWLKNENAPSSPFNVKKIVFSTGRVLVFKTSTFSTQDISDSKFDPNANGVTCSETKCSTYLDLMFVLDSSGSVGNTNWQTMVDFIKNMVKQTDISAQSGAIAVSGFGGGMVKNCDCEGTLSPLLFDVDGVGRWLRPQEYSNLKATYDVYQNSNKKASCVVTQNSATDFTFSSTKANDNEQNKICKGIIQNSPDYVSWNGWKMQNGKTEVTVSGTKYTINNLPYYRCFGNFKNCSTHNGRFYSTTYVPLNYKDINTLTNDIQQNVNYHSDSGTCQALGLIEVMNQWHKSNRPNENFGAIPQRVVIVLTDGDDHCAKMTQEYAKIIRETYGATLIEVGIGLETYYDKQLLENISTSFGGEPSYFDVNSFSALRQLMDKMINAVCRTNYTENSGSCNVKCHGYCGCGHECLCPSCTSGASDKCHSYSCQIDDDKVAGGCVDSPANCNDNLYCTEDNCDSTSGCTHTPKNCRAGLKTCEVSNCLESSRGQCSPVSKDASLCPSLSYPCYKAVCDPTNSKADSVTGCYYEYECQGPDPVVYENGQYVSGCYEYSCSNSTGDCNIRDICKEMSDNDKCYSYRCDGWSHMCVVDTPKVYCDYPEKCLLESNCNSATGTCSYVWKTAEDCLHDLKDEAQWHIGEDEWDWFKNRKEMEDYYGCGSVSCDHSQTTSTGITKNTIGACVFVPGSNNTCDACSGEVEGQPTFESCKVEAQNKHNQQKDTCYISTCQSTEPKVSQCVVNVVKTCESKPCMVAECNQSTNGCNYEWSDAYKQALANKNACQEVVCTADGQISIQDISQSKCVGENGKNVPICKKFDRCDPQSGCIYSDKCKKIKNCTTNTCNTKTNSCVEAPVKCGSSGNICYDLECVPSVDRCQEVMKDVEKVCGKGDQCNTVSCDYLQNKCVKNQIEYPNGTDLCHNYTCDVETGSWTVVEKCDDGDICTVDVCLSVDGSCTNYKRDCAELNMSGLGSCFARACSKSRKNGCFRKVYENSYFDECGNCIRGYTAGDSGLTDSETSNCKKALSFQEEAAVISAGVLAAIILACIIGAVAVSIAGTMATKELIRRARNASMDGSQSNPLFEDDGQEMDNPTFVGDA